MRPQRQLNESGGQGIHGACLEGAQDRRPERRRPQRPITLVLLEHVRRSPARCAPGGHVQQHRAQIGGLHLSKTREHATLDAEGARHSLQLPLPVHPRILASGAAHRAASAYADAVDIRRLGSGDEALLRDVRLRALEDAPHAFSSWHAREAALGDAFWTARVAESEIARTGAIFAALDAGRSVGMAGGFLPDDSHADAVLWGMWVEARQRTSARIAVAQAGRRA